MNGYYQMSIEFAPLNIPLERRLQTLAVAGYAYIVAVGGLVVLLISYYILLYTTYLRWLYITYLSWIAFFDHKACETGSRPNKWIKKWKWWLYIADYFPIKLIKPSWGQLDPKRNYLFCCFPHGMVATGVFTALVTEAREISKIFPFHNVLVHTLKINMLVPFTRELFLSLGAVSSSAESLNYILGKPEGGNVSALVIGGAEEAYHNRPEHYRLILKKRKGFIKIALRNGSPLVPVISFGEPDIIGIVEFEKGSFFDRFQRLVKKYIGIVPLIPAGRGIFQYNYGILPQRKEINVVVGEPIDVKKIENPSQEDIDNLHKLFMERLISFFESEKGKYIKNSDNVHLEIL